MYTEQKDIFKACPMCDKHWRSREAFLDDPDLVFNGYQANFRKIDEGLFYFTHATVQCGSTMALDSRLFLSLYSGDRYSGIRMYSKECRGYCLNRHELRRCEAHCAYAYVREVSQIILDRLQRNAQPGEKPSERTDPAAFDGAVRNEDPHSPAD